MTEHRIDRFAKRLAAADGSLSRRRFLITSAALAASTAVPLRFPRIALASTTTSCSCQGYADRAYLDCWTEFTDSAGPYNDGDGAAAAIQFGVVSRGAQFACAPAGDAAQANCREVPCPAGQMCTTPPRSEPTCQDPCQNRCDSSETCCHEECVKVGSDNDNCGHCGHSCISPSKCCNGQCATGTCLDCVKQQEQGANGAPPAVAKWFVSCFIPSGGTNPGSCQCTQVCSDSNNCGRCGNVCGAQGGTNGRCIDGKCVYDTSTYGFCTADPNGDWTDSGGALPGRAC